MQPNWCDRDENEVEEITGFSNPAVSENGAVKALAASDVAASEI